MNETNMLALRERTGRLRAVLPGMEIFPQIQEIHASYREFQFGFGEFWLLN